MLEVATQDGESHKPSPASRAPLFHRFFSSPAGSGFTETKKYADENNAENEMNESQDDYFKQQDKISFSYPFSSQHPFISSSPSPPSPQAVLSYDYLRASATPPSPSSSPSAFPSSRTPSLGPPRALELGIGNNDNNNNPSHDLDGSALPELDTITQLQREHDAYLEVLEAAHAQEIHALQQEIHALQQEIQEHCTLRKENQTREEHPEDVSLNSESQQQKLQQEVEHSLAAMREEIESLVRAEAIEERRKDKESVEAQFKEAMAAELETITKSIKEEAQLQMQAQLQSMKASIEATVRAEMRTETEHKVRLALVQQMRPQVRAELEQALRLEIRTVYAQEIRKEVEAAIVPEIEKQIAAEYKAKYARTQSAQKAQAEATIQAQLVTSKKALEERIRKDAEATIARKVAKKVESEVRVRVEKMKHEVRAECEAEAQKLVEASLAQVKQERAEIARLRAVENVRRAREEAVHKEAEAEFHKRVVEFKRYVQEEECRLARMKAVAQWRDEHPRRPPSAHANPIPPANSSSSPPSGSLSSTSQSIPNSSAALFPTAIPTEPLTISNSPPSKSLHDSPYVSSESELVQPAANSHDTRSKPSGLAFDFTFDVKLIAAKLISDAREHTHDILNFQGEPANTFSSANLTAAASSPQNHTPVKPIPTLPPSRSTSPVCSQSPTPSSALSPPAPTGYTLGPISTEQRAQQEFETQPPIVPPQGSLGARLRVLLPRLYQLWDECEISHIHRRDFSNGLRAVDVAQAERRVAMEIARLRRVLPTIHKEMVMVARREAIKAQLAQEHQPDGKVLAPHEKAALLAELRRVSAAAQVAIEAWEAANHRPFLYRGFPYLALMSSPPP